MPTVPAVASGSAAPLALAWRSTGISNARDVVALDTLLSLWREGPNANLRRALLRGGEGFFQHVVGQGHGGGGKGGHAALGIESGHPLESLVIAVGEVRAGVAVAVDVDQAGDDGGTV